MRLWYIYKVTNLITNKSYVGQHCYEGSRAPLNDHYFGSGIYLLRSIKKHGLKNFKKEILIEDLTSQFAANLFEEYFIKKENTLFPDGYNILKGGDIVENPTFMKGRHHTEETKKKIGNANRGQVRSEEQKKMISLCTRGKHHSLGTKQKMSRTRRGKPLTEEWRQKISKALIGHKVSEEQREHHSRILTGRHHSLETKKKMSKAQKSFHLKRKLNKCQEEL